jgi:hypothetical protein
MSAGTVAIPALLPGGETSMEAATTAAAADRTIRTSRSSSTTSSWSCAGSASRRAAADHRAAERVLERGQKTAWYSFIHPMRIGALVANGGDRNLDRFNRLGYLLGLAFQITDDVLNLEGSLARYGKEIGGDLWEGKRTRSSR